MAWVFHRLYEVVRRPRFRDARLFMLIFYPPVFTFGLMEPEKLTLCPFCFLAVSPLSCMCLPRYVCAKSIPVKSRGVKST